MDPDAVDALCGYPSHDESSTTDPVASETDRRGTSNLRIAYDGPDDRLLLDFGTTTNPAIPSGAVQAYQSAFAASRSYPSDSYCDFRIAAAEYVDCEPEQVIPTAGRPAALRLVIGTTVDSGDSVLLPEPSFEGYEREVTLQGADPVFVPHGEILDADPAAYDLVVVDTPNNPTGRAYDPRSLSAFADRCQRAGTPLLVDEAFLDFTDIPSLAGRDGVVVLRSLAKVFGFPGLRVGFAVATGAYRDRLDVTRLSWGVGEPAASLGTYCLNETDFVEQTRERVESERARIAERLEEHFEITHSSAPFLLLDAGSGDRVESIINQAREAGIVVRDARTFRGLDSHIRVSVRLPNENDQLVETLTSRS
ncbi:MAG: histidinol-phosphate transaminase [Halapricum sp.]